jgi:hypothetical protein
MRPTFRTFFLKQDEIFAPLLIENEAHRDIPAPLIQKMTKRNKSSGHFAAGY